MIRRRNVRELHEIAKPAEGLQQNQQSDTRTGLTGPFFGKLQLEQVRRVHVSKFTRGGARWQERISGIAGADYRRAAGQMRLSYGLKL